MSDIMRWRVNTPQLLKEIAENNGVAILKIPLNVFQSILAEVAERASELNDPKMNALMCRLAMYSVSDPYSGDYDSEITLKTIEEGYNTKKKSS
jgi:hypothetical protein